MSHLPESPPALLIAAIVSGLYAAYAVTHVIGQRRASLAVRDPWMLPAKVVGLTIDAQRLAEIRLERIQQMGGDRRYASLPEIYDELEYASEIHRRLGCPVFDVSELSIEEIAQRILRSVARRTNGATAS